MKGLNGMAKTKQKVAFEMECDINEFRNKCSTFFASKEGQEECVGRHASLVEAGKLRGDVFAECVRRAMSGTQAKDSAMTLSELGQVYESGGFNPFDESLPWIGIGMSENQRDNIKGQDRSFGISLAYTVETVGFDAGDARIIVKARDCSYDLAFAL